MALIAPPPRSTTGRFVRHSQVRATWFDGLLGTRAPPFRRKSMDRERKRDPSARPASSSRIGSVVVVAQNGQAGNQPLQGDGAGEDAVLADDRDERAVLSGHQGRHL